MKRVKRNYDQAFRDKAVQLALTSSKPFNETAEDLGIKATTLYQWIHRHETNTDKPEGFSTDVYAELVRLKKENARLKEEREILKKGGSLLRARIEVRYQFIKDNASIFNICALSHIMGVSRSGYYEWLNRKPSTREKQNMDLKNSIKTAYQMSRGVYGYRRIHAEIKRKQYVCSLNRVRRLMKEEGIKVKTRRKFKATTNSKHNFPINPNILERDFTAKAANTRWVTDITYIATQEGWLYLAVILDLFSRKVVGWAMDSRMTTELIKDALTMALKQRKNQGQSYLVVHSDRGSQYASLEYQTLLREYGLTASMSRKANCWDNAVAESFFRTLKTELIYHEQYATRAKASASIFEYIEVFYNRQRRHSTIGYSCPEEYERMALAS